MRTNNEIEWIDESRIMRTEQDLITTEAEVYFWETFHKLPSRTEIEDFIYVQQEFAAL